MIIPLIKSMFLHQHPPFSLPMWERDAAEKNQESKNQGNEFLVKWDEATSISDDINNSSVLFSVGVCICTYKMMST